MERSVAENFYVVGGTLARDAPSYVERGADKRLMGALQQGEICYVLTSRQMGKSSLMVRTAVRLREQGTAVAVLDLTSLGQNLTAEQWYNGLLDRTGQQLSLEDEVEDSWLQSEHLGPFQRWVHAMKQVVLPSRTGRVVIFIDEIDTVRSLPFPTDEFFAGIRELYNRRSEDSDLKRLTFCLLGVATPADLIRDTRTTPFNIGRRIELTDFSGEEALPLALGMGRDQAVGLKFLRRILYWTGGHPYLTQRLCQSVAEHRTLDSTKSVDDICTDLFLSNRARERDDNLLFVRDRMLRSEVDTAGLLSLYSKVRSGKRVHDDEADPLVGVLRLSGITTVDHGYLKVRNRIYEHVFDQEWIVSNLPGSELRRQRTAYKKGFKLAVLSTITFVLLLGFSLGDYYFYYRTNTTPPNVSRHLSLPVFWMSSSLRSASTTQVGSLLLKIGADNVTAFINNQQYGTTGKSGDLLVPGLPAGIYDIRLEKPGFQAVNIRRLEVSPDNSAVLETKLAPLVTSGELKITDAVPETTVRLDGLDVGVVDSNGSLSIQAKEGDHNLELVKDGYISQRLTPHVNLGKTEVVNGKLKPDLELREWMEISKSTDFKAFWTFIKKYPDGRFAAEAKKSAENLEWNAIKNSNDLALLDSFQKRYPQSQFSVEVDKKIKQLQKEQEEYIRVRNSDNPVEMQQFISNYPNSEYAPQLRNRIQDQQTILDILQQYEQAYDRKDMNTILRLWPRYPDDKKRTLSILFNSGQSGTLKLDVTTQPHIDGNSALVVCDKTRVLPGATSKTTAKIQLMKEAGSWVIYGGTL